MDNKCKDCKHFRKSIGQRGAIKGSCRLKSTNSYTDSRYGRVVACRFFEGGKADDSRNGT